MGRRKKESRPTSSQRDTSVEGREAKKKQAKERKAKKAVAQNKKEKKATAKKSSKKQADEEESSSDSDDSPYLDAYFRLLLIEKHKHAVFQKKLLMSEVIQQIICIIHIAASTFS